MAGLSGDQDNGSSSSEDENDAGSTQWTRAVLDFALTNLRTRANCEEDSFVRHLSTSLLSRMARNIFRSWESTRSAADGERVPDFEELVFEELRQFAQRSEIAEEYDRRSSRGSLEHDELEEQRRRERIDYHRSPRRRLSHTINTEDPTLDLDILQPVRVRSGPKDSPMSPMRGLIDPEEMRSYQRTERVKDHRRSHSKHIVKEAEREERRRLRRSRDSVESSKSVDSIEESISPNKGIGELESSGENKSDLQQKEFDTSLLNSESVGELHSSGEAKVGDYLGKKPEDSIIAQDAAGIEDTLRSSVEHTSTEYLEMKSLGSSLSSSFDSLGDFRCSEASTIEISKNDEEPNSELPSTGSGTSISSEIYQVTTAPKAELTHPGTERNFAPEESSTPSDELPTSIENPPTDVAHKAGARPETSQKDKRRRRKRTREVMESLTNRQITSLTRLEITSTDALELLIQLSVSFHRLDRLINGSSRESEIVDESVLLQFYRDIEYCRILAEMANRVPAEGRDNSQSSVPEITERPRRDPKDNA